MTTELTIKGTHCESCKALIEDIARDTKGIASCVVDFETGKTVIEHESSVDWESFRREVESVGQYKVLGRHLI